MTRRLVLEGIEDPEGRLVHAKAVPDPRPRFSLHDPLPGLDEGLDVGLLAGLRLDECQDPEGERHGVPPSAVSLGFAGSGPAVSAVSEAPNGRSGSCAR